MSFVRPPKGRSFGVRLALFSGVIFFLTTSVLLGVAGWIATTAIYDSLVDALRGESAELVAMESDESIGREIGIIEGTHRGRFEYLLLSAREVRLAGSLPVDSRFAAGVVDIAWPLDAPSIGDPGKSDASERLIAYGARTPEGSLLIVGVDGQNLVEAEEALWQSAGWGLALAALAGFAGAAAVGARYRRRVEGVVASADAIVGDQLATRIQVDGSGDEIDRLAVALNAMLDRLSASMEGLRQISNDIAHELRTPLSRLRQSLESAMLLTERTDLLRAVEDASAEAEGLLNIFAALLRIAQIEGGAAGPTFVRVDLSEVVTQIYETYVPVAEDDGHRIIGNIEAGIMVDGDRELLLQMFANLVENAIRHTPTGTTITVSLESGPNAIVAAVADRGPGIPAKERENVFKRFYRLDASRTTPGSGLGLAMVAAVAVAHGAHLSLEDADPGLRTVLRFADEATPSQGTIEPGKT